MSVAISIKNLTKTYATGFEALKGISLEVNQGDFFALTSILVDFGDFFGDPARGPDTDQTGGQGQIRSDNSLQKDR